MEKGNHGRSIKVAICGTPFITPKLPIKDYFEMYDTSTQKGISKNSTFTEEQLQMPFIVNNRPITRQEIRKSKRIKKLKNKKL